MLFKLLFFVALAFAFPALSQDRSLSPKSDSLTKQIVIAQSCIQANLPTTVAYKKIAGVEPNLLSLDIYAPPNSCNAPIVIWVHGGGYSIGDKANQIKDKVQLFNQKGWIFVSVNYRLTKPGEASSAKFPDHYLDVAAAIAWLRENASNYGGDPLRVALLGHSAGADIVANVVTNPPYLARYRLGLDAIICAAPLDTEGFDKQKASGENGDEEQAQWQNALGNNPNYLTQTSATLLIKPAIKIPPMIGVVRGTPRRQQIEADFLKTLQSNGIAAVTIDARSLTHNQVNTQIGAPGDRIMTKPIVEFLTGCFR